jgi:hypothetical protein
VALFSADAYDSCVCGSFSSYSPSRLLMSFCFSTSPSSCSFFLLLLRLFFLSLLLLLLLQLMLLILLAFSASSAGTAAAALGSDLLLLLLLLGLLVFCPTAVFHCLFASIVLCTLLCFLASLLSEK